MITQVKHVTSVTHACTERCCYSCYLPIHKESCQSVHQQNIYPCRHSGSWCIPRWPSYHILFSPQQVRYVQEDFLSGPLSSQDYVVSCMQGGRYNLRWLYEYRHKIYEVGENCNHFGHCTIHEWIRCEEEKSRRDELYVFVFESCRVLRTSVAGPCCGAVSSQNVARRSARSAQGLKRFVVYKRQRGQQTSSGR